MLMRKRTAAAAVVLIVVLAVFVFLAAEWHRELYEPIGPGLGDDLTQTASDKIRETFKQTEKTFTIYPSIWASRGGRYLKMAVGVKNNMTDTHTFVFNVIPTAISNSVKNNLGSDCASSTTPLTDCRLGGKSIYEAMRYWVTWSTVEFNINANEYIQQFVTITPGSVAPAGIYQYQFVFCRTDCTGIPAYGCNAKTYNWGISSFDIELKG